MARALAFALALGLAPLATAQDMSPRAAPVSGTLAPPRDGAASVALDVRAETEVPVDGCTGYVVPSAPDAVVDWAGGDLRVWVRADFDGTLAVHGPDGRWTCDDDTEGASPVVQIDGAARGRYAVWLGSFSPNPVETAAELYAGAPPVRPVLDPGGAPRSGAIDAQGGFETAQGAIEVAVQAGGPDAVAELDLGADAVCTGYVDAARPTAAVVYDATGGTGTLVVAAYADETDLVLLVRTPSGEHLCNDDYDGPDPAVVIDGPESGEHLVWVGTFGAAAGRAAATLSLAEEAYDIDIEDEFVEEPYGIPFSTGSYTPLALDGAPQTRISASADVGASADVAVSPGAMNPVTGDACAGSVETTPTVAVRLSGPGPFALSATSDDDLTLTVRTPSGGWFCSDDADGLDPAVQIDEPEPGDYLVWVGTFGALDTATAATVSATPGEIVVSGGGYGGPLGPTQSGGTYDGRAIRPGGAATTLTFGGQAATAEVPAGGAVENPVEGDLCHGFLSERPSAEVASEGGLTVSVSGDEDLTLVVRAPDGTWTCSDDADGTDPEVTVSGGPGTYAVWVGTYFRRAGSTARLRVSAPAPPPPPPAPEVIRG